MKRPFVFVNMAMTADGKITSAAREYPSFTSGLDRTNMDRLRAEADSIVVGAETMRADNPPLHVRDPEMRAYRSKLGKPPGLVRVLVTASGHIEPDSRFFEEEEGGSRIVATCSSLPDERTAVFAGRAEIWKLGRERVDLRELLDRLGRLGVERVLLEGGGELNWAFVRDDLVDEFHITVAPSLLGGREAPTLLEGGGFAMHERRRLRLTDLRREGDEIFCRYGVVRD
jgi:2,5-diamino-6-(ribosylamino)-4(3H)-pyrimidinone 5'-phosphate reductase